MAAFFDDKIPNQMIILPPNSEAKINCQRFGAKERCVGSFYVSNLADKTMHFLKNFRGKYVIDLPLSFFLCHNLYEKITANCAALYRDGLKKYRETFALINAYIQAGRYDELLFSETNLSLTDSYKYLKIDGSSNAVKWFKNMILGEITEIVIEKLDDDLYTIFLRPHTDVENWLDNVGLLNKWIEQQI